MHPSPLTIRYIVTEKSRIGTNHVQMSVDENIKSVLLCSIKDPIPEAKSHTYCRDQETNKTLAVVCVK